MSAHSSPLEETEQRIMPTPARGLFVALGLIAAAAIALTVAYALGWFSTGHHTPDKVSSAASGTVPLLARITLAIAVICTFATFTGALFRRFGQPQVVGEIVAGLILGPSVVSTLAPGLHDAVLPAQVMPYVNLCAQAGLAIFMFTVGAEFDASLLRNQRGVIGGASLSMMAVPFALGVIVAVPLLGPFGGPSAAPVSFVVFVGAALSVTAFPVLARIVQDTGLRGTRLGGLAMVCAAVADVLAWCALAVVLAMVHAQGPAAALRALGLTAALGAVCVLGLRPLIRTLSTRFAGTALPGGVRVLAVLGLIVGLATATDHIGVHTIFGGFLAGIVLPRGNPLFDTAAAQIGTINRTLFVPVFFAVMGMQADIRLAITDPVVLGGGALLFVAAVAGKFGGTVPVAWAGGMPGRAAVGLGVLMNARGVTEIVVLSIGLSVGVINRAAFTVLVIMALLTTCMAEPALRLLGLVRAGRRPGGAPAKPASPRGIESTHV